MNGLYIEKEGVDFDFDTKEKCMGICHVIECQNCGRLTTNDLTGFCQNCS